MFIFVQIYRKNMAHWTLNDIPWQQFDPAKADDKRECGLHAAWGGKAVAKTA